MARLLAIPTEILLNIINQVHFKDIENLTACCKDLRIIGYAHLQKHLQRKRAGTSIVCGPTTTAEWPSPFKVLRDIVRDDELAQYTTSMIIRDFNAMISNDDNNNLTDNTSIKLRNDLHPNLSGMQDQIAQKVLGCRYITSFGKEEYDFDIDFVREHHGFNIGFVQGQWIHGILTGRCPDATLALLIANFFNLTYLELSDSSWETENMGDMLRRVCWESHMAPQESHSLSKLTTVVVQSSDPDLSEDLELFLLFLHLPSVRTLVGKRQHASNALRNPIPQHFEIDEGSNAICVRSADRKISIEDSLMDDSCYDFLSRIHPIQEFRYNHQGDLHLVDDELSWEPSGIVEVLSRCAFNTLVSLDLTGLQDARNPSRDAGDPSRHGVFARGLLAKFKILKNIRVDHDLFIDATVRVGGRSSGPPKRPGTLPKGWEAPLALKDRVHALVHVLPVSVETLNLVKPFESVKVALLLFAGLAEAVGLGMVGKRFRKLRTVELEGGMLFDKDMVDAYGEVGVLLR